MKALRTSPFVGEHDDEVSPGLPAPLPAGERLLWRGSPDWRVLALRSYHLRKIALYFAVLIGWQGASALADGGSAGVALAAMLGVLPVAVLGLALIVGLSWLVARTAVYTLTDRRVVMRVGIVLTVTFNLPLRRIVSASLHRLPGGAGDIALQLHADDRISYLHLWPHARPWRLARAEPMLRSLPDAPEVAELLAEALQASLIAPVRVGAEPAAGAVATDAAVRSGRASMAKAA